ncbi:MAG: hypothetical protein IKJ71_04835 [Bacteroidaceae bacterium]|nr:hypothetical protein [Bacteroidaceae bacterium]
MKRFIKSAVIIFAAFALFNACSSEDDLTPSGNYSPIRGGFPQGNSEYDSIINDIKNDYGVYLLYKDITEEDLNRDWVSAGTGDIYVGGYDEERDDPAWNLPEAHLPFYVNFFYSYIFPNLSKEFAQTTFPVKIYMIHNLRTEPRDFGEDSGEVGGTNTDPFKSIKLGNFDNWAISFKDEVINGSDAEYSLRQQRCMFMIQAIYNAIEKGDIDSPDEFWAGYDFSSDKKMNNVDPSKANYKYKLGFVDMINDNFGTGVQKQVWAPNYANETSCYYWEKDKYPHYNLFTTYIKNAMWLTPEEFEARYPSSTYPMVKEKYNIVVSHMLETYGIDLVGIARGINK